MARGRAQALGQGLFFAAALVASVRSATAAKRAALDGTAIGSDF